MSQPLNPTACANLAKSNPDRVIRRTMDSTYAPTSEEAMNPENYGLSLDDVSPLGYATYDYGTSRQRAHMTEAWFVITA